MVGLDRSGGRFSLLQFHLQTGDLRSLEIGEKRSAALEQPSYTGSHAASNAQMAPKGAREAPIRQPGAAQHRTSSRRLAGFQVAFFGNYPASCIGVAPLRPQQ